MTACLGRADRRIFSAIFSESPEYTTMSKRRIFLKGVAGAAVLAGTGLSACGQKENEPSGQHNIQANEGIPVVLATWDPNVKATAEAMRVLKNGGSALDAVEAGARVPESDPSDTSVGLGGYPDQNGDVTLDACIMGPDGNAGSVTYLKNVLHPVSVARKVMEVTPHVMLSGDGALAFAREHGFEEAELLTDSSRKAYEKWLEREDEKRMRMYEGNHDTIGILAIDAQGDIAGACTTSGAGFKLPGRVGDSPIIGAGLYVDNEVGGATATGWGELAMRTLGAFLIVELMRNGATPQEACEEAIGRIIKKSPNYKDFQVGYIAVNKKGETGGYCIQPGFTYRTYSEEGHVNNPSASHIDA